MIRQSVTATAALLAVASLASLPVATTAWGATVQGSVRLDGKAPRASTRTITKDIEVCGQGERAMDQVVVDKGGLLSGVIVYIEGEIDGVAVPDKAFKLAQKECRFSPGVSFVPRGATLEIVNDDPVAHNIHAYEIIGRARRDLMNIAQPNQGQTDSKAIKPRRGNVVQLTCDIHDFMRGWLFVPDNPFADAVDGGSYTLEGVPAGKRTVKAFHPVLGFAEQEVTLEEGKTATVNLVFKAGK
ncbi:MAG: hypothetical protein H8E45_05805 [Proteobacteria bacterium]|nr:hypothetical protein [Pseudomonadota bacterium]